MKKITAILVLTVIAFSSVQAQSKIKVFLSDARVISIELDGRHFNKTGTSITVGDLPAGKHRLSIFEFSKDRWGGLYNNVLYQGKVKTFAGMLTYFELDDNTGNIYVHDEPLDSEGTHVALDNKGTVNHAEKPSEVQQVPEVKSTLDDARISAIKTKVDDKKTDSEKMGILKEELQGEKITTAQVGSMMDWMIFESTKVELAKWFYNITQDKDNYISLINKLTYKNYEDDLVQFLKDANK